MKKILGIMCLAAMSAMAASANRVGPVSTYGELKANGGKLSGSCPDYSEKAVQVKGMSLFWSSGADSSTVFYSEKAVNAMVKQMNIEVIRFAMGVTQEKFKDEGRGYLSSEQGAVLQKGYLKNVVNAAIENDIYVIIDWHIESSNGNTDDAVKFFEYAAQEYGSYNNVIFEVWNEPLQGTSMSSVASHANTVIAAIRKFSDNLVLVGSPDWSSHPEQCASAGIQDSKKNFACTLHFYAATHQVGDYGYNSRAAQAMSSGVPVFASEWGTVSADGNGSPNQDASKAWIDWMNQNHVSWANWSASAINEKSAAFQNLAIDKGLTFTQSGNMVKGWMNGTSGYSDCHLQNGNGSNNSGFSSGVANGTKTDMIDDMEDGDRFAYTGGWWSAFADSDDDTDGEGATTISNSKWENDFHKRVYDVLMEKKGDKNTSNYMVGIEGIKLAKGGYKYAPYVAIGLNLRRDTLEIDLSACKSISYKFKGASHNFRVETSLVKNWNFHHVNKDASEEWKEVELTWDQFTQESWGDDDKHFSLDKGMNKVQRFAWEVKGALDVPDYANQPKYDYLYIDDVRCNGASITAISGGNTSPKSSSSTINPSSSAASSSSVNSSSSSSSSSAEEQIVSSSSAVSMAAVMLIDDVEDGNEVAKTTGTWYAYTDKEPGGLSTISNVYDDALGGYVVVFPGTTDPTNGTEGFVAINEIVWNQGSYENAPFVALGLNLHADTSLGVDLSRCEGLSYRYKGASHRFKVQDGQVKDYAYHERLVVDAEDWTTVVVLWEKLTQPSWTKEDVELNTANIKKMAWEVVGYAGFDAQPTYDYLYVDDLVCVANLSDAVRPVRKAISMQLNVQGDMLNVMTTSAARIQVFDMMGNLVMSKLEGVAGNHQVSLEGLNRGNYVVRVTAKGAQQTARISLR
ncbi:CIA30 family protein [uncultured Fibrobacter sp.]|uniref:CIA30 family protein n=1 Tax=uncultured Fibrobacter sp. TaxID=261512 RepID=UPI00261CFB57|nr:CIA30 family protein [uncultured Fibrobacter sp.]